jgi:hypothetical protein
MYLFVNTYCSQETTNKFMKLFSALFTDIADIVIKFEVFLVFDF